MYRVAGARTCLTTTHCLTTVYAVPSKRVALDWKHREVEKEHLYKPPASGNRSTVVVNDVEYKADDFGNVTPKILAHVGRNLHRRTGHPIATVVRRIVAHLHRHYEKADGRPLYTVHDRLDPVVTVQQNFDSLLVPAGHVSRGRSDCYYLSRRLLLRAHMTAHQSELVAGGRERAFLMVGDVYRRDAIDSTHYPVFHQADGVRLFDSKQLSELAGGSKVSVFEENGIETEGKQAAHTAEAMRLVEQQLKSTLVQLVHSLFGKDAETRWVTSVFPFTHPSWELEIRHEGKWLELLGCGVIRHDILQTAGAGDSIGWAFGVGVERLAMRLYSIPDIRLFWSNDSRFLDQFKVDDIDTPIKYKPISVYPKCPNDFSFWLPENRDFHPNDFYDLVRDIAGDIVEEITLVDEFRHPVSGRESHCYRIVYRHMERTLTQPEVNDVHATVRQAAEDRLGVTARIRK